MSFKEIKPEQLLFNPFDKIGSDWMLITAGDKNGFNTMTASWGGMGVLWNKNVLTTFVRPQRYTKEFIDNNETFTVSFYSSKYKDALTLLGRKSGRDEDKVAESGLTPCFLEGTTAFQEASIIFVCRKLYQDPLKAKNFIAKDLIKECYPEKDYHTMYISEIVKVIVNDPRIDNAHENKKPYAINKPYANNKPHRN